MRDLAGLLLNESLPIGAVPATLATQRGDGAGQRVQLWGPIPAGRTHREGHVTGVLLGRIDRARLQVDQELSGVFRARAGFSGGPVWDQMSGQIVGVVQAVPTDEDAVDVYVIDGDLLVEAWPDVLYRPPPCPYKGLAAFTPDDSAVFFGREALTQQLVEASREQPLITVYGQSGSGKSSVVAAGLVPALRREGSLAVAVFRPGAYPLLNLASALVGLCQPGSTSPTDLDYWISKLRAEGLAGTREMIEAATGASRMLIVADQFEQIFTECASIERREEILELLRTLVVDEPTGLQAAISVRRDFFGELTEAPEPLGSYIQHKAHKICAMTPEELTSAITGPARVAGGPHPVEFAPGLVELILKEFRGRPTELPLLEFTLTRLWERQTSRTLTLQTYLDLGGVTTALSSYADAVIDTLSPARQQAARRIFTELVQANRTDIARQARRTDLRPADWSTVELLRDHRLLVINNAAGGEDTQVVELAHEALLRTWHRLHDWLNDSREFREWKNRTISARDLWQQYDHDPALLLPRPLLLQAKKMVDLCPDDVIGLNAFLDASHHRAYAERHQEDFSQRRTTALYLAERSARALNDYPLDPTPALVLAFESIQHLRTWQGSQALLKATLHTNRLRLTITHDGEVTAVGFSTDGIYLATGSTDGTARIWELANGTETIRLTHDGDVTAVAYNHSGSELATTSADGYIRIWDLATGTETTRLTLDSTATAIAFSPDGTQLAIAGHDCARIWDLAADTETTRLTLDSTATAIAFSPDGAQLAAINAVGTVETWDLVTSTETARFAPLRVTRHGAVHAVAYSPDRTQLAIGSADGTAGIWDLATGAESTCLTHDGPVYAVAYSPDGTHLASGSADRRVRVWELIISAEVKRLIHSDAVHSVAYSPSGAHLATASASGFTCIWDLATSNETVYITHSDVVYAVSYSPDGTQLATGSADGIARIWDLALGAEPVRLNHGDVVYAVSYSPDGTQLATGSADGIARIWDLALGTETTRLAHDGEVTAVAFSPDGIHLATASFDGTARIWDLALGTEIGRLAHDDEVTAVAFSPDGTRLATASTAGTAQLWDLATRTETTRLTHDAPVTSVAYNHNGSELATTSADGYTRIWDLTTSTETARLAHDGTVYAATYSPDSAYLATAGSDNTARIWDSSGERVEKSGLASLQRNLSPEEWSRFLPDIEFRRLRTDLS
ncbi:hypothetical protein GCM10010468_76420 [Actinocorallia longicatena]|uniref:Novel STAND NTPase 1 domain-containing protein n=2 Tax=Actinocorallia longicatena TaxID=111803 RepID=A0ABP6QLC8_9ACTN